MNKRSQVYTQKKKEHDEITCMCSDKEGTSKCLKATVIIDHNYN